MFQFAIGKVQHPGYFGHQCKIVKYGFTYTSLRSSRVLDTQTPKAANENYINEDSLCIVDGSTKWKLKERDKSRTTTTAIISSLLNFCHYQQQIISPKVTRNVIYLCHAFQLVHFSVQKVQFLAWRNDPPSAGTFTTYRWRFWHPNFIVTASHFLWKPI